MVRIIILPVCIISTGFCHGKPQNRTVFYLAVIIILEDVLISSILSKNSLTIVRSYDLEEHYLFSLNLLVYLNCLLY